MLRLAGRAPRSQGLRYIYKVAPWNVPSSCMRKFSTTPSEFEHLTREQRGNTTWIRLNRPKVHNAFNEHVIEEIHRVFLQLHSSSDETRCVVLTGEGASFSAGADLNWMAKMTEYSEEENRQDSDKLFAMFAAIKHCPVPTIARVNGAALGGGAGLVAACDMAFCVDKATMGFTEVGIGLVPAVISKFVMDKIGRNNCSRYFLTGERFQGATAKGMGLVHDSVASLEELDEVVEEVTGQISKVSPKAVRRAKQLIEEVASEASVDDTRALVTDHIAKIRVSPEGQEGLRSFLEKRAPAWLDAKAPEPS